MLCSAVHAGPSYLSLTFVSGRYAAAVALNDAGRYAVNNFGPEAPYEVAYISGPPVQEDVGSLGGRITRIRSINNAGEAIGASTTAEGALHSFLYSSGRMQDLGTAYGAASVNALNEHGDIAGQGLDDRALVIRDGRAEPIGPGNSAAVDINEAGQVVVEYAAHGQGLRTAIYRDGAFADLPTLGGAHLLGGAINDAGWVSGYGTLADGRLHAWLYDGERMADLTPAAASSTAHDINTLGHVVGTVDNRAFLYADGRLVDLNAFVDPAADVLLSSAFAINDHGQILARSCDRTGVFCYATVLLDAVPPIPEPSSLLLFAAGLAMLRLSRLHAPGHGVNARGAQPARAGRSGTGCRESPRPGSGRGR